MLTKELLSNALVWIETKKAAEDRSSGPKEFTLVSLHHCLREAGKGGVDEDIIDDARAELRCLTNALGTKTHDVFTVLGAKALLICALNMP